MSSNIELKSLSADRDKRVIGILASGSCAAIPTLREDNLCGLPVLFFITILTIEQIILFLMKH